MLLTLGVLLLLPAVWATGIMLDMDIWRSDREDASSMATMMLVAWPIALAMIAAAIWCFAQVKAARASKSSRRR